MPAGTPALGQHCLIEFPAHPHGPADNAHHARQLLGGVCLYGRVIGIDAGEYELARHGIQNFQIDHIFHAHCVDSARYRLALARGGLFALRLLRHAEAALAARGVGIMQYSSPASRPCHALYRRLVAHPTETIWNKILPLQPRAATASAAYGAESVKEDK